MGYSADHISALGFGGNFGHATYLGPHEGLGRGRASMEEMEQLSKALVASEGITDPAQLINVGALMPQELDTEIKMLTMTEKHLTLWRDLQNLFMPVKNTVHEYAVQTGYGVEANWTRQMELPLEDDPDWARGLGFLKIIRTLYKTGDIAMAVRTIQNPETKNREAAMIRLMRAFEWSMIVGDSSLMPEWVDGIQTVIRKTNSAKHLIDLRGAAPTINRFEEVTQVLRESLSTVETWRMYCTTAGRVTLDQIQRGRGSVDTIERFMPTVVGQNQYDLGSTLRRIVTGNGDILPVSNMMMGAVLEASFPPVRGDRTAPAGPVVESKTSVRAPDTPAVGVTIVAPGAAGSKWTDADKRPSGAGTNYGYRVTACNRWGESAASAVALPGAIVAATGAILITITPTGVGNEPDFYKVYGQYATGDQAPSIHGPREAFTVIGRVKASGNNAVTFTDLNDIYPRHTSFFILDTTTNGPDATLQIGQLLPVINQPIAKMGPFDQSFITMTAMPMYYAPLRMVEMYNVPVGQITLNPRVIV